MKETCCSLAEKIGGRRLADLDAELRRPDHRSFRKLAEALGVPGQKSAVERHKHRCLRVGEPFVVPPVASPPDRGPVRVDPVPRVPEVSQGQGAEVGTVPADPSHARAPESITPAKTLAERMAYIVSRMGFGTWDSARDTPRCAAAWGLHEDTVRTTVRHILEGRRMNRGDVAEREEEALAFYAWQVEDLQAVLKDCVEPDEKAKVHARLTEVRGRMDAVAIPRAGTVNNFNFATDPRFLEAAQKYVDTVQEVLDSAAVIAGRLSADPALVASVLTEADALLRERLTVAKPLLLEPT